jgi:transcriptional regulator with XRE-family HTH domain
MMNSTNRNSKAHRPRARLTSEYDRLLTRLIAARKAAGVTQVQVAQHLGKPQSHVSKCESKEREIGIIDLWKWCGAIGITLSDLIQQFEKDVEQSEQ